MKKNIMKIKEYLIGQFIIDAVVVMLMAYIPILHKEIFDKIDQKGSINITLFIVIYVGCLISIIALSYVNMLIRSKGNIKFKNLLKTDLFEALSKYKNHRFNKREVSKYISIFNNDIRAIQMDYLSGIVDIVKSINTIGIYAVSIFIFIDWRIAVVLALVSVVNIIVFPKFSSKKVAHARVGYINGTEEYVGKFSDLLKGIRLFNSRTSSYLRAEHRSGVEELKEKQFRYGMVKTGTLVLNGASIYILYLVSILLVVYLYINGQITIGGAIVSLGYVEVFIPPIQSLMGGINSLNASKDVRKKYMQLIWVDEGDSKEYGKNHMDGNIKVENLSVEFDNFKLQNFSYEFEKGKKYALIGHSGSGKSTVLKSLVNLNEIQSGTIKIDDIKIEDMDTSEVLAYMDQDEHIFSENMKKNITIFNSYSVAGFNLMRDLLEGNIYKAISKSENCKKLSGGEKRVVALLRKIVVDAPVFILDEPFTGVDKTLSKVLMNEILKSDKTVIMTTHDINDDLEGFDEVIHMSNGLIIESGRFNQLQKN